MDLPRKPLFTNKQLIALVIPIFMEQMLGILVGLVDGLMVSSVGEAAISGVSLVGNVSTVLLNLATSLAAGGAIVASQFLGAGRKRDAQRAMGHLLTMTVGAGVIVMTLCLLFNRPLLTLFFGHVEKDVMDTSVNYFAWLSLSYPFLTMITAGAAILRVKRNTKVSFYVSIIRNVVNIIGNAILIYWCKMGAEGAAIATAISRVVGAATILMVVFGKKQEMRPTWSDIFHIDFKLMARVTRVGLPTGIENSMFQLGRLLTLSMISGFGTFQIAANTTAGALTNIVVTISTATRTALLTVIGQCVGARDNDQIQQNYRKGLIFGYIAHGVGAILFVVFRYQLLGLYDSLEPDTIALAAKLMCIHLIPAIFLYPVAFQIPSCLRAANDSAFVMWVSILSMAIFRLTLAWLLCVHFGWGAPGVYAAMVVDWVCRSICYWWRWHSGAWKKKCGLADQKEVTT